MTSIEITINIYSIFKPGKISCKDGSLNFFLRI